MDDNVAENMEAVLVHYPDAPGDGTLYREYDVLHEYGRLAVVYGLIPDNHGNNGQYHAYLIINTVRGTIDYYSPSEAQAVSMMVQLEHMWEAADMAILANNAEDFAEEDREAAAEDVTEDLIAKLASKHIN